MDVAGQLYDAFVAGVFGALTASFLCVVGERVPHRLSIGGRSHCACGRQLRWRENIPVIGYLRVRGVAPCCGARIPPFYLRAEITLGVAWAASGWWYSTAPVAAVGWGAACAIAIVGAAWRVLGRSRTT